MSSGFLEQGCNIDSEVAWKELKKVSTVSELAVTGREFFSFEGGNGYVRWGCRNLYGATHIVVNLEDFELKKAISGEHNITLVHDTENYKIRSKSSCEQLGTTTESLWIALESLRRNDGISGLILSQKKSELELKGIGHMKFDEY